MGLRAQQVTASNRVIEKLQIFGVRDEPYGLRSDPECTFSNPRVWRKCEYRENA